MLNCKITAGFSGGMCQTQVGGLKKIAIASYSPEHTFTSSGDDCLIDTIELAEGLKFFDIAFNEESAHAESTLNVNGSKDNKNYTHLVDFTSPKLDCDALENYKAYSLGQVIIAVLTKNGDVELYGAENGLSASTFTYTTGSASGDATGVTAVFDGVQLSGPLLVKNWSLITALMA